MTTLKTAREKFKKGDKYFSATGNLPTTELIVIGKIRYGLNQLKSIFCDTGCLYDYDTDTYAKKI